MTTTISTKTSSKQIKSVSKVEADRAKLQRMLECYPAERQVQYLHLQAEMDMLIQQLQALKNQAVK